MRFAVYLGQKREFRWRLWSANNKIIADCGEGYQHNQHCVAAITLIRQVFRRPRCSIVRQAKWYW